MISAIFLTNSRGEIIIFRAYRNDVKRSNVLNFCMKVIAAKEAAELPIQSLSSIQYCHVMKDEIVFGAATKTNINVAMVASYLGTFLELFMSLVGVTSISESIVRTHLCLILEMLDETLDAGYPQVMDKELLKKLLTQCRKDKIEMNDPVALSKLSTQVTGKTPYRQEGIVYKKNEVYIDIVEKVNVLVSKKGQVLRSDVVGKVDMKSHLSGIPECKIGLNDKLVVGKSRSGEPPTRAIVVDDVNFHQCVSLTRYETDRTIAFIPPDGTFDLMNYRVSENIQLPFRLLPSVQERARTKIDVSVKIRATFGKGRWAKAVVIRIPCPKITSKVNIRSVGTGKAKYEGHTSEIVWRIKKFPGDSEYVLVAEVDVTPTVADVRWNRPPITLAFQVPMFTSSGLNVRFLRIQVRKIDKSAF
eukprot:GHVP01063941.1.p1 GENE.GHVP01063941.1~~GHVP01063941.1.p1  ORF type:complete len:416 (-),score=52.18 GHVP01063941.1:718-1965(-)